MRRQVISSFVALAAVLLANNVLAQQASNPPFDFPKHVEVPGERNDNSWYLEMVRNRSLREPNSRPHPESRVIIKGVLAPSLEDRATFAAFLKRPDTGLIRLVPRDLYDPKNGSKKGLTINGNGAYYSFAFLSHEYGYGSDLELLTVHNYMASNGKLIEGKPDYRLSVGFAGADYGMMTKIGDVSLDDLSVGDPRAGFLVDYEPPRAEPKARCEAVRFRGGVAVDGQLYLRSLTIQENVTYLLRSMNYGTSDVLVGFRVVGTDPDSSVTIAWKLLKEFPSRKLDKVVYVGGSPKC